MNQQQILSYYRKYIREANRIPHYSFREYAKRKIRSDFQVKSSTELHTEFERLKRISSIITIYCKMI